MGLGARVRHRPRRNPVTRPRPQGFRFVAGAGQMSCIAGNLWDGRVSWDARHPDPHRDASSLRPALKVWTADGDINLILVSVPGQMPAGVAHPPVSPSELMEPPTAASTGSWRSLAETRPHRCRRSCGADLTVWTDNGHFNRPVVASGTKASKCRPSPVPGPDGLDWRRPPTPSPGFHWPGQRPDGSAPQLGHR